MPLCLFLGVSAGVFALAKLALAEPSAPTAVAGNVELGDSYRGQIVYSRACAGCHGDTGEGGAGPKLAGSPISLAAAQAQIENGGGTMPAQLVSGRQLADVLAYLSTIVAAEEG